MPRGSPLTLDTAWGRLLQTAQTVYGKECLNYVEEQQASQAAEILATEQTSPKRCEYRSFLYGVLAKSGPGLVLVTAIALGQARVFNMANSIRVGIIKRLPEKGNNGVFSSDTLDALSARYGIPQDISGLAPRSYAKRMRGTQKRVDQSTHRDQRQSSSSANNASSSDSHASQANLQRFLSLSFQVCYSLRLIETLINGAGRMLEFTRGGLPEGTPKGVSYLSEHIGPGPAKFRIQVSRTVISELGATDENGFHAPHSQVARLFACDSFATSTFYPVCNTVCYTSTPVRPGLHIIWDSRGDSLCFVAFLRSKQHETLRLCSLVQLLRYLDVLHKGIMYKDTSLGQREKPNSNLVRVVTRNKFCAAWKHNSTGTGHGLAKLVHREIHYDGHSTVAIVAELATSRNICFSSLMPVTSTPLILESPYRDGYPMVSGVVTRPRWHLGSSQRRWLGGSIPWSSYTDRPDLKSSEAATWDAEEKSKLVTKAVVAHGATSVRHNVGPEARDMRATG
ncbi:hypothetical protein ACCO45_004480 [Purpureocillium lilacinum]|uniref:Uncharacterized protein n=1 Tax=Purpureocillium lilacinum TaxID=33203 RepID=A0ACC4E466_PURLI